MKLGLISDTHDNIENIKKSLRIFDQHKVDLIIHLGDVTSPSTVEFFPKNTWFVHGNLDSEATVNKENELGFKNAKFFDEMLDNKRIFMVHGDNSIILNEVINSGLFDYVFHGHTHIRRDEVVGRTRVLNPGGHIRNDPSQRSIMILDLKKDAVEYYIIV